MFHQIPTLTRDGDKFPLSVYYEPRQNAMDFHRHDFVELVLILSGSGVHTDGVREISLHRGDVCVIPRGVSHSYRQVSADLALINILFTPEALPVSRLDAALLPGFRPILTGCLPNQNGGYISFHVEEEQFRFPEALALALAEEHETSAPGNNFVSLGIFMALAGRLARCFSAERHVAGFDYGSVSKIIAFLNKHYREEISIAKLCAIGGMSKSSLMRNFKNASGVTPLQYLLRLRVGEAAFLLRSTEKTLGEIAAEVGFNDVNYLSRQFKRAQGLPPALYRKKYGGRSGGEDDSVTSRSSSDPTRSTC